MSESRSILKSTSYDFEQEVLTRFRCLVDILPPECHIYRETWDSSTVLCLDFQQCPHFMEIVKEKADVLIYGVQNFSLATCILFRHGNQLKAWRHIHTSH